MRWDFEGPDDTTLLAVQGGVTWDEPGPRPPEFPDFSSENKAVRLDGKGSYLSVADEGTGSRFDFHNGDPITLEAWVNLDGAGESQALYVVGKGRTNSPDFARDNQNWALRVSTSKGVGRLSFLFATQRGSGTSHWHRWNSTAAFDVKTGWHHIAVAYQFGQPESIRGWIDGVSTDGVWDLGGATTKPPIVDNDAVWIGSSLGGNASNCLRGWLDGVAIHRGVLSDEVIASRFHRIGGAQVLVPQPPSMPDFRAIPSGKVLVTFAESLPSHAQWPYGGQPWPEETARWTGDAFLLPRVPLRYDDWGIRSGWKAPVLVRMAADVHLPAGEQKFLLRARALGRLWIDGQLVAETKAITKDPPNGEEPIIPVATPPLPGLRAAGYRQQEVFGYATIAGDSSHPTRVVLEMVAGGNNLRTETGEVCVAIRSGDGATYHVLRPGGLDPLPLTDAAVQPVLARIEASIAKLDDESRRTEAGSQDAFWERRHAAARRWAASHPPPNVPPMVDPETTHPVDRFIEDKIQRALAAWDGADAQAALHFHDHVLPILRENCFGCHDAGAKGGLDLTSRPSLMGGGDSGAPGVVPGDPEASELIIRVGNSERDLRMPPTGKRLSTDQIATLKSWIRSGARWPAAPVTVDDVTFSRRTDDARFLRRIYLDTVGFPPSPSQFEQFLSNRHPDKREQLIDRLLADERCADNWISQWLDMLAENPTLLNKAQGSTGPFRFFLHDSLRDNKPIDRMVTELILMRGGAEEGGSAGFAIAAENDAPLASKAHIIASAFLGVETQCARCHDAPFHNVTQRDLFSLAAMLQRKPATVPGSSRVPEDFFAGSDREPLIEVTLHSGEEVTAQWPFETIAGIADTSEVDSLMSDPQDSRERLAALITAPGNLRFPRVIVNRIWRRLMGAGLVEPVHDWEGQTPSHPQLLDWLADQFITNNYDARHIVRLITTSEAYQRRATGRNLVASPERRFFNAPELRRLTAEQIVDSLHAVVGAPMDVGELTFVHDGRRPLSNRQTLGRPTRGWMLASLNNERDRPSLSLPRARAVTDVMEAFGWTGSRQKPIARRNTEANLLQPGVLANGVLTNTLTRAARGTLLAQLAVDIQSPAELVDQLFVRVLTRRPKPAEREALVEILAEGFDRRLLPLAQRATAEDPTPLPLVTWFNHLQSDATTIQQEIERRVRAGPPPDPRLAPEWREVYEDVAWSLINHREFVWMP